MRSTNLAMRQKVVEAIRNFPDEGYAEIGKMLGITQTAVSYHARNAGIVRRHSASKPGPRVSTLQNVDSEIEALERKLKELKEQRESLLIHFEHDADGTVFVFGVSESPLTAHYSQWLRFLKQNGAGNLREYINKHFLNGNGVH